MLSRYSCTKSTRISQSETIDEHCDTYNFLDRTYEWTCEVVLIGCMREEEVNSERSVSALNTLEF